MSAEPANTQINQTPTGEPRAINGRIVTSVDDMHRLLSRVADRSVMLTVVRGTRQFDIAVKPHLGP